MTCLCRVRAEWIWCIFKAGIISVVASEYLAILPVIKNIFKTDFFVITPYAAWYDIGSCKTNPQSLKSLLKSHSFWDFTKVEMLFYQFETTKMVLLFLPVVYKHRLIILSVLFTVVSPVPWLLRQLSKHCGSSINEWTVFSSGFLSWWMVMLYPHLYHIKNEDLSLRALFPGLHSSYPVLPQVQKCQLSIWSLLSLSYMFGSFHILLTTHLTCGNWFRTPPFSLKTIFQNTVKIISVVFLKYKPDCDTSQL